MGRGPRDTILTSTRKIFEKYRPDPGHKRKVGEPFSSANLSFLEEPAEEPVKRTRHLFIVPVVAQVPEPDLIFDSLFNRPQDRIHQVGRQPLVLPPPRHVSRMLPAPKPSRHGRPPNGRSALLVPPPRVQPGRSALPAIKVPASKKGQPFGPALLLIFAPPSGATSAITR